MNKFFVRISITIVLCLNFVYCDVSHVAPVDRTCMDCLCQAMSNCDKNLQCAGDICGMFKITWPYWADSGKPTQPGEDVTSQYAYPNCVNEHSCAERAVQGYMGKFGKDCNGDGIVNCLDYAAIHKLGGYGCNGYLPEDYKQKIEDCLNYSHVIDVRIGED